MIVAILCSDIHLSERPPAARSAEPDWFAAQQRALLDVRELAERHGAVVLCPGDIFDRWNSPPSVINFAIDNLPDHIYVVPGQHDLPHHRYEDVERSAYWTLVQAGKVRNVGPRGWTRAGPLLLRGFPYGTDPEPADGAGQGLRVALLHRYVWSSRREAYVGAPAESRLDSLRSRLAGYDVAVFGDNHIAFVSRRAGGCTVYNCGCLVPRSVDERRRACCVGLLHDDGRVEMRQLSNSKDRWAGGPAPAAAERPVEMDEFFDQLSRLERSSLDYRRAIKRLLEAGAVDDQVAAILLEALENDG